MAIMYSTRRGIPVQARFTATSVAGVTLLGPDQEIAQTDPVPVQVGATDVYTCVVTPDEWGQWLLVTDDGAGNVTSTTEIECRPALAHESTYETLVPVWPTGILGAAPSAFAPMGGQTTRAFVSTSKLVIPLSGMIWGCSVYVAAGTDTATSLRFFAASPAGVLRGVSDDLLSLTPDSGAWATGGWVAVRFTKPVVARALDSFGLEIAMGASADYIGVQPLAAVHIASGISARNGALAVSGAMTFASAVAAPCALALQPLIAPPDVVVAGHSIMACHGANAEVPSHAMYELSPAGNDWTLRDYDLAIQLSALTGRTAINVADGGTELVSWTAAAGLFASNIAPLHPRVVLFDTLCNDRSTAIATIHARMSVLLALCDAIDAELVVVEAPPVEHFQTDLTAETHNVRRCAVEQWCALNGVQLIPTCYALGEHSGSTEHSIRRNQPKGVLAGTEYLTAGCSPYSSSDETHLTAAGYIALASAIARGLRAERGGAVKSAMTAAAILASKTTLAGADVHYLAADNSTDLASTTVDLNTRGLRTAAVVP